jgi:hypothetical protein
MCFSSLQTYGIRGSESVLVLQKLTQTCEITDKLKD